MHVRSTLITHFVCINYLAKVDNTYNSSIIAIHTYSNEVTSNDHTIQVLRSVNPSVTYASAKKGYVVKGIAIALNLFLKHLDTLGIEHESPAVIRKDLQRREDAVVGRYKQYFLRANSQEKRISRSGPQASTQVKCRASVAIPAAWLSKQVLDYLNGKTLYIHHNLFYPM